MQCESGRGKQKICGINWYDISNSSSCGVRCWACRLLIKEENYGYINVILACPCVREWVGEPAFSRQLLLAKSLMIDLILEKSPRSTLGDQGRNERFLLTKEYLLFLGEGFQPNMIYRFSAFIYSVQISERTCLDENKIYT